MLNYLFPCWFDQFSWNPNCVFWKTMYIKCSWKQSSNSYSHCVFSWLNVVVARVVRPNQQLMMPCTSNITALGTPSIRQQQLINNTLPWGVYHCTLYMYKIASNIVLLFLMTSWWKAPIAVSCCGQGCCKPNQTEMGLGGQPDIFSTVQLYSSTQQLIIACANHQQICERIF